MINSSVYKRVGVERFTKLPACAWPGGYPLYYLAADNEPICPKCVNGEPQFADIFNGQDKEWHIVSCDVYYEGPPMQCANCNCNIESAYGDPDCDE